MVKEAQFNLGLTIIDETVMHLTAIIEQQGLEPHLVFPKTAGFIHSGANLHGKILIMEARRCGIDLKKDFMTALEQVITNVRPTRNATCTKNPDGEIESVKLEYREFALR